MRVGAACPAGDWPEGLPVGAAILYVRPGAPGGGAGTRSSPYGKVSLALAAATSGTVVALAKGTFTEAVSVPQGVTLWGACVALTRLAPSNAVAPLAVDVRGAGAAVRNLSISGPATGIGLSAPGASVELRDVIIDGATATGVLAHGAVSVTGSRIAIRNTGAAADGDLGQAIEVGAGAQAELTWVVLEGNHNAGAVALGKGTLLRLTDAAICATHERQMDRTLGRGVVAEDGARLEADRVALEGNHEAALWGQDNAQLSVQHAVIRRTLPSSATADIAVAVGAASGARLSLRASFLDQNLGQGIGAHLAPTYVELEDVVVRGTLESPTGHKGGFGITGSGGALLRASRLALEGNRTDALRADEAGTVFNLEDVAIRDTLPQASDGADGLGMAATSGATVVATRVLVEGSSNAAVGVQDARTRLVLSDATLRATQGFGLTVTFGAQATVSRLLAQDNHEAAVLVALEGSSAVLEDLTATDTHGDLVHGQGGEGLHVQQGGTASLRRALIERSHEVGVIAYTRGTVTGVDVTVRDTQESECPAATCLARGGIGVAAGDGSSLQLEHFRLAHNASMGIAIVENSGATLSHGEVSGNPIGASVQVDGFDFGRLQDDVIYEGNAANLDARVLPLPKLATDVSGISATPNHR